MRSTRSLWGVSVPEITIHQRGSLIQTVTLPPVWGQNIRGQVGGVDCSLLVDGTRVCQRYRTPRTAQITETDGTVRHVKVAGSGGHATRKAHRRRGYNARLDAAFLAAAQADGYDLAMLFCVHAQAAYNGRLGWHMRSPADRPVTYEQPGATRPVPCPSGIWTGIVALQPGLDVMTIRAIHVEGLPW